MALVRGVCNFYPFAGGQVCGKDDTESGVSFGQRVEAFQLADGINGFRQPDNRDLRNCRPSTLFYFMKDMY